eukprot:6458356-Amphidinium_carterae.2
MERSNPGWPRRRPFLMKERDLDGQRPNYAAEAAPGKLLNRVTVVGTNLGGPRRRADLRQFLCQCACHVHACLELVSDGDRDYFQQSGFASVSYHQCSVLWRSTTFQLAHEDHLLTEDSPGRWGIAAVAARLTPHLNAGHMKHVTIAAVHVCNILAKRPHAVLAHLETLKEFFLRNEVDIAYMDANQASFAKSATTPSTVDAQFPAEAGYLQSGAGGSLH